MKIHSWTLGLTSPEFSQVPSPESRDTDPNDKREDARTVQIAWFDPATKDREEAFKIQNVEASRLSHSFKIFEFQTMRSIFI